MVDTFGMRDGSLPDVVGMRAQLDANDTVLMDTAQHVVNHVRGRINDNATRLGKVEARIRASVNGHLRRNTALLKGVGMGILDGIRNAVDGVQVHVNSLTYRPDVQKWLKEFPPAPAWGGIVPRAPLTAEVAAALDPPGAPGADGGSALPPAPPGCFWRLGPPGSNVQPALICPIANKGGPPGGQPSPPPPPPPPTGSGPIPPAHLPPPSPAPPPAPPPTGNGNYMVFLNCQGTELAAVPQPDEATQQQLLAEGWCLFSPRPDLIYCADPEQCSSILDQLIPQAQQICAQIQATGQGCFT